MGTEIRILDFYYDAELMEALHEVFQFIWFPPSTFFISNNLIAAGKVSEALEAYVPKQLSTFLARHLDSLTASLQINLDADGGWELWSRVSGVNSPSFGYLHIDNDELLRSKDGTIFTPVHGTVLYVGPNQGIEGGETAFWVSEKPCPQDHIFTNLPKDEFLPPEFKLVSPRAGRLVVFRGSIPHAVIWANTTPANPRVTLLANYWNARISSVPHGVCSMSPGEYKGD
ncbi:conserved hypothetical protein [Pseudomonas sp. 9AZ]|uniref:2OG-Fe(II) oxygenase n=1 Tax=Pseudomonas sp. 9AZ TaxID=2653168 RepID=UPI0012F18CEA|nr:2OG-Fe(II) oxygenase [Pseudomonas sp. 9AZ]VXC39690.1 conserved hypothetical protein [Pseudomonas sp. 9AZ]